MIWDEWWAWAAAALVLGILEILAPAFILLGFAFGAAGVALLLLAGGPFAGYLAGSLPWTLVVFATLSLLAWLALKRIFGLPGNRPKVWDRDINDDP